MLLFASTFAAEQVLDNFRDRFIAEMNAVAIVSDLAKADIITEGVQESIRRVNTPERQNKMLHDTLKKTSTNNSLKRTFGIIVKVKGNPRMVALGKAMQKYLNSIASEILL